MWFVWKWLCGPLRNSPEAENSISFIMNLPYWKHQQVEMDVAIQEMCRYRLLDIFVDVIGIPKHPEVHAVAPLPFGRADLPETIKRVSAY
jgi:hypothetical protein